MVLDLGFLGDTVHLLPALWHGAAGVSAGGTARHRRRAHHLAHGLRAVGQPRLGLHALSAPRDLAGKFPDGRAPAPGKIRRGHQPQRLRPFKLADVFERRAANALAACPATAARCFGKKCSPRTSRIPSPRNRFICNAAAAWKRRAFRSRNRNFTRKLIRPICARRTFPKPTREIIFTSARSPRRIPRNCRRNNSRN